MAVAKFLLWGSNIYIYFLFFAEMGFFFLVLFLVVILLSLR